MGLLGQVLTCHPILVAAVEAVGVVTGILIKDLLCLLSRDVCHFSPTLLDEALR